MLIYTEFFTNGFEMKKYTTLLYFFSFLILFIDSSLYSLSNRNFNEELHDFQAFIKWVSETTEKIERRSKIAHTPVGPIEYIRKGDGPVVLCLHGGFGGFDQGLIVGDNIVRHGYTILCPSRPGYLRTPLSVGASNAEQADALVNLLDKLEIDKVCVIGFSAGAPVAFELAARHPNRVWGVVFESLGTQPNSQDSYNAMISILSNPGGADFISWELNLNARYNFRQTAKMALEFDNTLSPPDLHKRIEFVLSNHHQTELLRSLIFSAVPSSPRRLGTINDIQNLAPWTGFPLEKIVSPTLIIEAFADKSGFYPEAQFVHEHIPGSILVSVRQSGHFIWLGSETKEWHRELLKFLRNNAPKFRK